MFENEVELMRKEVLLATRFSYVEPRLRHEEKVQIAKVFRLYWDRKITLADLKRMSGLSSLAPFSDILNSEDMKGGAQL